MSQDYYKLGSAYYDWGETNEDASFKIDNFKKLLKRISSKLEIKFKSIADVGCGNGNIVKKQTDQRCFWFEFKKACNEF